MNSSRELPYGGIGNVLEMPASRKKTKEVNIRLFWTTATVFDQDRPKEKKKKKLTKSQQKKLKKLKVVLLGSRIQEIRIGF